MSVTAWPRLILDWPRVIEGWQRTGSDDYLFAAGEAGETWLESYRSPEFNANWHVASEASDIYDALRAFLKDDDVRNACDWLASFFCNEATPPKEPGVTAFAVSLNPTAVKSFAALGRALDLELLRPAFEAAQDGLDLRWFQTFDEFASYLRRWVTLLHEAEARDAGIVMTIA